MESLLDRLRRVEFGLIVSLPRNDVELARAAIGEGASAVKLHLNCEHRASGTVFGTFAQERRTLDEIARIARDARCSLGIMPGATVCAAREELEILSGMGFEFLDIYADHLPASYLELGSLSKMVALGAGHTLEHARHFAALGIDALEASIVPPEGYGESLKVADLLAYRSLVERSRLPVVVPTQRKVTLDDVGALRRAGVAALMIGAIVTGSTARSIAQSTRLFRVALEG